MQHLISLDSNPHTSNSLRWQLSLYVPKIKRLVIYFNLNIGSGIENHPFQTPTLTKCWHIIETPPKESPQTTIHLGDCFLAATGLTAGLMTDSPDSWLAGWIVAAQHKKNVVFRIFVFGTNKWSTLGTLFFADNCRLWPTSSILAPYRRLPIFPKTFLKSIYR